MKLINDVLVAVNIPLYSICFLGSVCSQNRLCTLLLYIIMLELCKATAVIFWYDAEILYMVGVLQSVYWNVVTNMARRG
jgi:hypothetical protein